jgi:hypothetical protein
MMKVFEWFSYAAMILLAILAFLGWKDMQR